MISLIHNALLRRILVVLFALPYVAFMVLLGILGEIETYVRSIDLDDLHAWAREDLWHPMRNAWRGRAR